MPFNTAMGERQPCPIRQSDTFAANVAEAKLPSIVANRLLGLDKFLCKTCIREETICEVSSRDWGDYRLSTIPWYLVCYHDDQIVYPLYIKKGRKILPKKTNDALRALKSELGLP
jgi:hypothetical protein